MLVAISGGHLAQLHMLAPRIADGRGIVWMTDDTAQSRSLLAGERVYHVPTRPPRDHLGVLRDSAVANRAFSEHSVHRVVSSGAQIALSALIPAMLHRVPFSYVESATRVTQLSATGRLLERVPSVRRYVQYPSRATARWGYALSVFDGFRVERGEERPVERAVVTLGGNGEFGFRRLVESAARVLPPDAEVFWQVGSTDVSGLDIDAVASVPTERLAAELAAADVVIGHAGTGTALAALCAGRVPVLAARSAARGEHIDDHQSDLAGFLAERGLAIVRPAGQITIEDLREAARWRVELRHDLDPVSI